MGRNSRIRKICYTGLMSALCFLGTYIILYRTVGGGYVHIGDSMVFLTGALLGPYFGAIAAGIGSALTDVIAGAPMWVPATLIIKALMAMIIGFALRKSKKFASWRAIMGMIISVIILVSGYYLAEAIMVGNFVSPFIDSITGNLIQGGIGSILGFLVFVVFDKTNLRKMINLGA